MGNLCWTEQAMVNWTGINYFDTATNKLCTVSKVAQFGAIYEDSLAESNKIIVTNTCRQLAWPNNFTDIYLEVPITQTSQTQTLIQNMTFGYRTNSVSPTWFNTFPYTAWQDALTWTPYTGSSISTRLLNTYKVFTNPTLAAAGGGGSTPYLWNLNATVKGVGSGATSVGTAGTFYKLGTITIVQDQSANSYGSVDVYYSRGSASSTEYQTAKIRVLLTDGTDDSGSVGGTCDVQVKKNGSNWFGCEADIIQEYGSHSNLYYFTDDPGNKTITIKQMEPNTTYNITVTVTVRKYIFNRNYTYSLSSSNNFTFVNSSHAIFTTNEWHFHLLSHSSPILNPSDVYLTCTAPWEH